MIEGMPSNPAFTSKTISLTSAKQPNPREAVRGERDPMNSNKGDS